MGGSNHTVPFYPNPQSLPFPPTHPLYPCRAPPDPPAPPEEGEVLYTHVVSTKQMGGESRVGHTQRDTSPTSVTPTQIPQPVSLAASPRATTLQDPQVTYAELRGPHGRQRELSDIYGNVL